MNELLVSKTRVKKFLKKEDMRVSCDFYSALDNEIKQILLKGTSRAKKNRRSTILSWDL